MHQKEKTSKALLVVSIFDERIEIPAVSDDIYHAIPYSEYDSYITESWAVIITVAMVIRPPDWLDLLSKAYGVEITKILVNPIKQTLAVMANNKVLDRQLTYKVNRTKIWRPPKLTKN